MRRFLSARSYAKRKTVELIDQVDHDQQKAVARTMRRARSKV